MKRISPRTAWLLLLMFSGYTVFAQDAQQKSTEPVVIPSIAQNSIDVEYKINPFDLLEISVYGEADLNKTVRVSQDGYITFPYIGKVKVATLDVMGAQQKIVDMLAKDYLVNPNVTIFVKEYSVKKVLVLGEVKTPGSYIMPQDKELTTLEAIALAGGFSPNANIDGTKIIRMDNGTKVYITVTISDITKRGDKTKDIPLKPNDVVFVPERIF